MSLAKSVARLSAEREQQENEQDDRLDNLEQQAQGALADDEFTAAKATLLGG